MIPKNVYPKIVNGIIITMICRIIRFTRHLKGIIWYIYLLERIILFIFEMTHLISFDGIHYMQSNINIIPYVTANKGKNTTTLKKTLWLSGCEKEPVKILLKLKCCHFDNL